MYYLFSKIRTYLVTEIIKINWKKKIFILSHLLLKTNKKSAVKTNLNVNKKLEYKT